MASILNRFKTLLVKQAQNTNINYNKAIYNWLGNTIIFNQENDETYIREGYQRNATVFSIINRISNAASTVPFQIYEVKNSADAKRYKSLTSGGVSEHSLRKANMLRKSAFVELQDTQLHDLLKNPNPAQSYAEWIIENISFSLLTGNDYIYGIGPDTGPNKDKFTELYVLPAHNMEILSGGLMRPVRGYKLTHNGTFEADAENICHIKTFNPEYDGTGSHLYGQSPLRAGLKALSTNNEASLSGLRYLQNQMSRGVLMSKEGSISETQAKQLKEKFRTQYQGSNNAGDVIVTANELSWINFGLNAADVSLIEQQNASVKDLCNIYGVPVQLLNNTDSTTFNNMEEAKKAFWQNAVLPEMIKLRDCLNNWLAPKYGENFYIDFDFSSIADLQTDQELLVKQMTASWWLSPNEKRLAMNYGESTDKAMNEIYIPANLMPINMPLDEILNPNTINE
jgi:HK97 family phage portal protein